MNLRRSGPWIGVTGLVAMLWFYLTLGLVAPWWAVLVMLLAWVAMVVLSVRWARPHPYRVLAMPVFAAALWFGVLLAGGAWWGWTA